ncbi:hypothetical protein [Natronospora cellulosivora (SeqCode)]
MIIRKVFKITFLETGSHHWRLLILPFVGAFLALISFDMSESWFVFGNASYTAVFYTVFLLVLNWIGSSIRDKLFTRNVMELILLWPIKKEKRCFAYI